MEGAQGNARLCKQQEMGCIPGTFGWIIVGIVLCWVFCWSVHNTPTRPAEVPDEEVLDVMRLPFLKQRGDFKAKLELALTAIRQKYNVTITEKV